MCRYDYMQQVLQILARNATDNVRPDLVRSVDISDQLNMDFAETKQLLTSMNGMGIIECNLDVDYSLITREGFQKMIS